MGNMDEYAGSEKRVKPRFPYVCLVRVMPGAHKEKVTNASPSVQAKLLSGKIRNISQIGIYVEGIDSLGLDDSVTLQFEELDQELNLTGLVSRVDPLGVGIKFSHISAFEWVILTSELRSYGVVTDDWDPSLLPTDTKVVSVDSGEFNKIIK
jgi:hypothetical protein